MRRDTDIMFVLGEIPTQGQPTLISTARNKASLLKVYLQTYTKYPQNDIGKITFGRALTRKILFF